MTETTPALWSEEGVLERFRAVLADVLVLNEDEIHRSSKLVDDLDADSIGFLELTWRLRRDFGIPVPEVKVDEETLTMSLLDGLERIGAQAGGVTLFEFMKESVSRGSRTEFGRRAAGLVAELLAREDFATRIRAALDDARDDPDAGASLVAAVRELRATPEFSGPLASFLERHRDLARDLEVLERSVPLDAELGFGGTGALWTRLLFQGDGARRLFDMRVADLGALLGSGVPEGLEPDARVDALVLRDLFRFITVDAYVQYILFLRESTAASGTTNG